MSVFAASLLLIKTFIVKNYSKRSIKQCNINSYIIICNGMETKGIAGVGGINWAEREREREREFQ